MKDTEVNYTHKAEYHNDQAASEVLPFVFNLHKIESVIDIGCGMGTWLSVAKKLGKKIQGVDGIEIDKNLLYIDEKEIIIQDLREKLALNKKFDLAICLEVAEHLPMQAADIIIETITEHSDFVLFSAAIPHQTGDHHINEQWPVYWQKLFERKGFYPFDILRPHFWNNVNIDWWYRQNMLIYTNRKDLKHLGSSPAQVLSLVHPGLVKMKEAELHRLASQVHHLNSIGFFSSVKRLIRSILPKK